MIAFHYKKNFLAKYLVMCNNTVHSWRDSAEVKKDLLVLQAIIILVPGQIKFPILTKTVEKLNLFMHA